MALRSIIIIFVYPVWKLIIYILRLLRWLLEMELKSINKSKRGILLLRLFCCDDGDFGVWGS